MKINSSIHDLSAKHRGNLKPTPGRIEQVTLNSEIAPLSNPWLYVQLGRLEGTFKALGDLDWGVYLERSLEAWVGVIRAQRDREEAKLSSRDLVEQQTFDPEYLVKLNERLAQRERAAQEIRERISNPSKLAELSIQALLDTVNNGNPGQGVFTFNPHNEVLSQVLQLEKPNPEFLAAFEKSNPKSVYVLSGLVEYLKQVDPSGELARALLANIGVELYLLTQNADELVAHIISEGVERLVTGSKFDPDNPGLILKQESPLDLKIIDYGKNILQARGSLAPTLSLPSDTVPIKEVLLVGPLVSAAEDVTLSTVPPAPSLSTVDNLLNDLRVVDEHSYLLINNLRERNVISDDQAIVLALVAQDSELSELAAKKDFQTLQNRIANHPLLVSKNVEEIVNGVSFSSRYFVSNAYCKWVCDYLRDVASTRSKNYGISLQNYMDAKIPVLQVDKPKICDRPVTSDITRFNNEIENFCTLIDKALEKEVIDQNEYDLIIPLFRENDPTHLPRQEEANEIARKLEFAFYDLFYKVSSAVSIPEVEKYILELRKRIPITTSAPFNNLAKVLDVKPLILQSYLVTQKLIKEPEEIKTVPIEVNPGILKDTEETTVPKVLNDFISLFFGVYASDYSSFEDFKAVLLEELNKEFGINSPDKIEENLKQLNINDFSFGVYKAYLEEKGQGKRPSLDGIISNSSKYCKAGADLTRIAVDRCLNRLQQVTGLSLFYSKPVWNPIVNNDGISLESVVMSPRSSGAYLIGEAYLTYIQEVGIPPTKEQLLRRTKGRINENELEQILKAINKNLNDFGYAPLLVFNQANEIVRTIFAVYKESNDDLDSLSSNSGYSKENLARALIGRKNEAGFNETKAFDPDFEIALATLQAKARDYLTELEKARSNEKIVVEPTPYIPTEDDITLVREEVTRFLSKKENTINCQTPAKYAQEATSSLGTNKDLLLKAIGLNEDDLTVCWCFWKAKRHGSNNLIYFPDLLREVSNRLDRDVSGKELLDSLQVLSILTSIEMISKTNLDGIIVHHFIEEANIPAASYKEYVVRLGQDEILSAYELGDYLERRLQVQQIGSDEWKIIWASKRNGLFNSNPHQITQARFERELRNHRYAFSSYDQLESMVRRLNSAFSRLDLNERIEFYKIPTNGKK